MTEQPARRRHAGAGVVAPAGGVLALLVSHDGARWLPTVLDGLAGQALAPDHVVAVDTGSSDGSDDLLRAALGASAVVVGEAGDSFAAAVRRGLADAPPSAWVWLLHDDSTPDPGALATLVEAVGADPEAAVLGPKLREWPSLGRLLEVGVTLTGTGQRETGLEPGEWDQGQHDRLRDVLAVNTAGMLVRRDVLAELGFDDALPVFGADLDFGWRVARAGHRTIVVPQAVVFHAEAAERGLRRTPLTGERRRRTRRAAALHTVLADTTGPLLVLAWVRLLAGGLLRALGLLVARAPRAAGDEVAALAAVYGHPGRLRAARRDRAGLPPSDRRVRRLLAPVWLPYRHALDTVGGLVAAATHEAADVADRRRAARRPEARASGAEEDVADYDDSGWVVRYLTDPVALVTTVAVLALLWATHQALHGAGLSAAGLSPAPESAGAWWRLYVDAHHPLGSTSGGSDVAAPPYLPVLALLGTVLGGSAGAAVALVLLAAAPLALWGAWRLLRTALRLAGVRPSRWVVAWGAITYAAVPLTSGVWGQGRLGGVVGAALLPWLAGAALGYVHPVVDRRRRAGWRCAVLLAVTTAFAPVAWAVAVVLTVLFLALARPRGRDRWLPPLVPLVAVPVLLVPWTLPTLVAGRWPALLLEAGRLPSALAGGTAAAGGRLAAGGAPLWAGLVVAALAVAALLVPAVRVPVLMSWAVAAVAAVLLAGLGRVALSLPTGSARPGVSLLVVLLAGAAVAATALGLAAAPRRVLALGVLVAAVAPVAGLAWAVTDRPLRIDADEAVPAYMSQNAATAPDQGILVVSGSVDHGLAYAVRRGERTDLGEDEVVALTPADPAVGAAVSALVTRADGAATRLAALGVAYVLMPAPADGQVAAQLDATDGLEPASAVDPDTRAWHLVTAPSARGLAGHGSAGRWALIVVQGVVVVVALVLSGPARRGVRS